MVFSVLFLFLLWKVTQKSFVAKGLLEGEYRLIGKGFGL